MKQENKKKTVLICPLNWGLGHATRCVPIIKEFLSSGFNVIIAADKAPLAFLKQELATENVSFIVFPWLKIRYQKRGSFFIKFLILSPILVWHIFKEHFELKKIIKKHNVDFVVSDNRYGLWSGKAYSVFITHQLFVKAPFFLKWTEPVLFLINKLFLLKFNKIWIPDMPGENNISGTLSHKKKFRKTSYIGLLSRFTGLQENNGKNPLPVSFPKNFILAMLSGPEPQRSLLEEKLLKMLKNNNMAVVFLRGKAGSSKMSTSDKFASFDHLPTLEILYLIRNAQLVICRPGYSSLMDLALFNKKTILIPTPGQTEQEYLGKRMHDNKWSICIEQRKLQDKLPVNDALMTMGLPDFSAGSNKLLSENVKRAKELL